MLKPTLATVPAGLKRVARADDPLRPSVIDRAVAGQARIGNRFDVVGAGVLYFATESIGAFAETTAPFRPSAAVRAAVRDEDPAYPRPGTITALWRARRRLVTATLDAPLPFLDVEHPATHEYLTTQIAAPLAALGVGVLDVPTVRGPDRRITRTIAAWTYDAVGSDGEPIYGGIRYLSRFGPYECWAVFDGNTMLQTSVMPIEIDDPGLAMIADLWNLTCA